MIVTTKLLGGIGNNLFQIATCISYSLKHGIDYCIPTEIENPHYPDQKIFYSPYINYCSVIKDTKYAYTEQFFHYTEIPKFEVDNYVFLPCVLVLKGYFQSWKYFDEYREEILKLLNIPYEFKEGYCSIQVRRGDYLKYPNIHPPVTNFYLQEAQKEIINKGVDKFIVFSDDIEWCKDAMCMFDDCEYEFSEGKTEIEDLAIASSCSHNIGSNSSFGWWIYWLNQNENKIGIFPRTWFGESMNHDTKDLYMPQMILM